MKLANNIAHKVLDILAKRAGYLQHEFRTLRKTDITKELVFVNDEGEYEIVHPHGRNSTFGYSVPIGWDEARIVENMFKFAKEQKLVVWDNCSKAVQKTRVIKDTDTLESLLIEVDLAEN